MAVPLLTTKLYLPPVRAERVQRERLLARLDETLRPTARLALISAPAGFGKTSLLAEWLARRQRPAAWVALDAGDNSAALFLAYLTAAVDGVCPGLVAETQALLRADPPAPLDLLLAGLVNELAGADPADPLVIALDDFQFVTAAEVRQAVAFLVEHLPAGVRLALATRSDPPLPLARLRARGQMVELRAADLRFTPAEAARFLVDVMGLNLPAAADEPVVAALTARTEGWAAGLQMAALALQAAPGGEPAEFVRTFTGSHRFVLDYLAEEVLTRLPAETVEFLLQTAPLDRFCADLGAAVVDPPPADPAHQIDELERANLFLVALDGERRWFRYHHLFADLLRARLRQTRPAQVPGLYRRAAGWFEGQGMAAEAIQYRLLAAETAAAVSAAGDPAQAAADYEQAARLVEQHTYHLFAGGQLHALMNWIGLLPPELANSRPWLCVYRAWIQTFAGAVTEIEPLLRQAETLAAALDEPERTALQGHCAAIRCHRSVLAPGQGDTFAFAREADEKLPPGVWARGQARWASGFALRAVGRLDEAGAIFDALARADRAAGNWWGVTNITTDLGIVRRLQGRLREALAVYREGLALVAAHGVRRYGYTGRLLSGMASLCYDRNDLAEALALLDEARALNDRWRNPNNQVFCYSNRARVFTALGQFADAAESLAAAHRILTDLPVIPALTMGVQSAEMALRLAAGQPLDYPAALEPQIQQALGTALTPDHFSEPGETHRLLLVRALLAQARPAEALRLIAGLEPADRALGRGGVLIELLTLKALALALTAAPVPASAASTSAASAAAASAAAAAALAEAVERAAPEGSIRLIVDCGYAAPGRLGPLLAALRGRPGVDPAHLEALLRALPAPSASMAASAPAAAATAAAPAPVPAGPLPPVLLVEPLSERELEVLGLLAAGLTNAQIAARLVIATGTVKAHTASIFRKLDAANRTQAVALARAAGLIT